MKNIRGALFNCFLIIGMGVVRLDAADRVYVHDVINKTNSRVKVDVTRASGKVERVAHLEGKDKATVAVWLSKNPRGQWDTLSIGRRGENINQAFYTYKPTGNNQELDLIIEKRGNNFMVTKKVPK